jgi:hypothetical protein
MSKSYRIRTKVGVDTSIKVLIDQEFEHLEILSLKILQTDIYTRQCADYGVIVGRVSINNGFGVPNAKVSIFIPIDSKDQSNPVISELYPYKSLSDVNDDGYRYNLLPYVKSYSAHIPTGTFFNRMDVLTNPTLIEVYDKYYKYNAVTNESGDYMIFGVPVGSHLIVLDVDLSDIGEFSLSPQDLIRMGIATESQVSGTNFKSSNNLRDLPQIVSVNRSVEVEPLWGQPEICNLGITRTDFDLSAEANIDIRPTSIFMGSIVSSNDNEFLPRNCRPRIKSGSLCSLVSGPGEILAIRQTIFLDNNGRPVLETVDLESGGQVIDDNGTWLVDVPMNLDYLITNEFGDQVISNDPKKGIPTKGKYRFKVKWNQPPSLSETVKRAYFLVPNIREHGWVSNSLPPDSESIDVEKSYAFSLDWNDYVDTQSAIDCEDTFYMMQYNKVYTVSQLIDQYRKGYLNNQFIGIKNILDDSCESENNKFPTNDSVFRFDLIYFLFWIMIYLFRPILLALIPVIHILWFVLKILAIILTVIIAVVLSVVIVICNILRAIIGALANLPRWLGGRFFRRLKDKLTCPTFADLNKIIRDINSFPDKLKNIKIPNLSYPECSFCDCGDSNSLPQNEPGAEQLSVDTADTVTPEGVGTSLLSPFQIFTQYVMKVTQVGSPDNPNVYTQDSIYQNLFAGDSLGNVEEATLTSSTRVPDIIISTTNDESPSTDAVIDGPEYTYFTSSLTIPERLNLFNTKAKYFDQGVNNPGGGVNRIKVTFQPDLNTDSTDYHYDNVLAIVCIPSSSFLEPGNLITFQDLNLSKDINVINSGTSVNQFGTNTITGTPINFGTTGSPVSISFNYAKPDGSGNQNISYQIVASSADTSYAKFPTDIEYFQVITGVTYTNYTNMCNTNTITGFDWDNKNSFNDRFLSNEMSFYRIYLSTESDLCFGNRYTNWDSNPRVFKPIDYYRSYQKQIVYFLVRGVDPNTTRTKVKYDLSRLFGYDFNTGPVVIGDNYKLNYPIHGSFNCVNHQVSDNLTSNFYFDSFHFKPSLVGQFSFSSFTSNLHTYYSNLDVTNGTFKPGNSAPTLTSVTLPLSPVSKVVNTFTNTVTPPQVNVTYFYSGYTKVNPPLIPITTYDLPLNENPTSLTSLFLSSLTGEVEVVRYISQPNTFTSLTIDSGTWTNILYARRSSGLLESISYWVVVDEVQSDGTTFIANIITGDSSSSVSILSATTACVFTKTTTTPYVLSSFSSRIRVRIFVKTILSPDLTIYMGGNSTPSRLILPQPIPIIGTQGWNGFIIEWDIPYVFQYNCSSNNIKFYKRFAGKHNSLPNNNRGYYPGEIVEGGSMFYQELNIRQELGVEPMDAITHYYAPKYSSSNNLTIQVNSSNPNKIVMRSDRLPTSTTTQDNLNNSFSLHTNTNFAIFTVTDDGVSVSTNTNSTGSNLIDSGQSNEYGDVSDDQPSVINEVVESFNCGKMAPLSCYANSNNTLTIKDKGDDCWSFGGGNIKFDGGCYILITQPIVSLLNGSDFLIVFEWTNRIQTMFGACRNVFSHLFTNNWINGVLYAFSFSNDVIYDSNNQPISRYCTDTIYFDQKTRNFYYRSSPWNNNTSQFVGDESPSGSFGGFGGNFNNLKYPTTIMDLGPRSSYLQEIVFSDKFDGYVLNRMNSTTYGDVSELLNLLIITRLASPSFLTSILGVGILSFFSRTKLMVDGDYAQMISINSELGVSPFQSTNYPDNPPGLQNPIYYDGGSVDNRVLGIFFSSDTQTRDFISPKRTIINSQTTVTNSCAFNNFPVFSQTVPFYQWELRDTTESIFGSQNNEWGSLPLNDGFFSYPYQSLDRVMLESRYMRTSENVETQYYKGYIYSVDVNGNLNPNISSIIPNTDESYQFNVGAPFHFYFGLKKGKSAFDRFTTKWINTQTTL